MLRGKTSGSDSTIYIYMMCFMIPEINQNFLAMTLCSTVRQHIRYVNSENKALCTVVFQSVQAESVEVAIAVGVAWLTSN